jgi:hypothetical protein
MSTISSAPAAAQGAAGHSAAQSWTSGLAATLKRWRLAYTTRRAEQAAMTLLWSIGDRELRGVGITRFGIPAAVRDQAARVRAISGHY